jgi:hypothetical protein
MRVHAPALHVHVWIVDQTGKATPDHEHDRWRYFLAHRDECAKNGDGEHDVNPEISRMPELDFLLGQFATIDDAL